ncbi:MAG: hypothetical protein ACK4PI_05810 [Tepidisphaerales bacterium]
MSQGWPARDVIRSGGAGDVASAGDGPRPLSYASESADVPTAGDAWAELGTWLSVVVPSVLAVWLLRGVLGWASPDGREAAGWAVWSAAGGVAAFWVGRGIGCARLRPLRWLGAMRRPGEVWVWVLLPAVMAVWPGLDVTAATVWVVAVGGVWGVRSTGWGDRTGESTPEPASGAVRPVQGQRWGRFRASAPG